MDSRTRYNECLPEQTLDMINAGIILLDAEGRVMSWNAWTAKYSGISADSAKGKLFDEDAWRDLGRKLAKDPGAAVKVDPWLTFQRFSGSVSSHRTQRKNVKYFLMSFAVKIGLTRNKCVASELIGASKSSQIEENIEALKNAEFSEEELKKINEII